MEGKDVWQKEQALQDVVEFRKDIGNGAQILLCFMFLVQSNCLFGRARWQVGVGRGVEVTVQVRVAGLW